MNPYYDRGLATESSEVTSAFATTTPFNITNATGNTTSPDTYTGLDYFFLSLLALCFVGASASFLFMLGHFCWQYFRDCCRPCLTLQNYNAHDNDPELGLMTFPNEQTPLLLQLPALDDTDSSENELSTSSETAESDIESDSATESSESESSASSTTEGSNQEPNETPLPVVVSRQIGSPASSSGIHLASSHPPQTIKITAERPEEQLSIIAAPDRDIAFMPELEEETTWYEQCRKHFPDILFPPYAEDIDFQALYIEAEEQSYFHMNPKIAGARESAFRNAKKNHFPNNEEERALLFDNIYQHLEQREALRPYLAVRYFVMQNKNPQLLAYLYKRHTNKIFHKPSQNIHCDVRGWTRLHYAAYYNQIHELNVLLEDKNANIHTLNNDGKTAASLAAEQGHFEILIYLHNEKNIEIDRDLYILGLQSPSAIEFFRHIQAQPIWLSTVDDQHMTILHYIARAGQTQLIPHFYPLLNSVTEDGQTPLTFAVRFGHLGTAATLINLGTDVTTTDIHAYNLFHHAAVIDAPEVMALVQQKHPDATQDMLNKCARETTRYNAYTHAARIEQRTALDMAIVNNSSRALTWLLSHTALNAETLNSKLSLAYHHSAWRSMMVLNAYGAHFSEPSATQHLAKIVREISTQQELPRPTPMTTSLAMLYIDKGLPLQTGPHAIQTIHQALTETRFEQRRWLDMGETKKRELWRVFEYILSNFEKMDVRFYCLEQIIALLRHAHHKNVNYFVADLLGEDHSTKPFMKIMHGLLLVSQVSLEHLASQPVQQKPGIGLSALFKSAQAASSSDSFPAASIPSVPQASSR